MNLVAVYGSLRKGLGNYSGFLAPLEPLSKETSPPEYTMVSLGGFPGVIKGGKSSIVYEVYEVPDRVLQDIDRLEGHPEFYERELIPTPHGPAWMYFLPQSGGYLEHHRIVDTGDWLEFCWRGSKIKDLQQSGTF